MSIGVREVIEKSQLHVKELPRLTVGGSDGLYGFSFSPSFGHPPTICPSKDVREAPLARAGTKGAGHVELRKTSSNYVFNTIMISP